VILPLKIIDDDDGDNNYDDNGSVSSAVVGVSMSAICGAPTCCGDGGGGVQLRNLAVKE
jgi:hypothetical protein